MQEVFNEIGYINFRARIPNAKAIALNGMKDKYGYETTGLRY